MYLELDLTEQELARLRELTQITTNERAVSSAAREFLRLRMLQELKGASGQVDFDLDWQSQEALELDDLPTSST